VSTLQPSVDGIRMDPNERSFEWWYFGAQFSDGSTAVVVFKTKDYTNLDDPLTPIVSLTITRPDGSEWNADVHSPVGQFHAAAERCDVQMGSCRARGDLHIHTIHGEAERNSIDLTFTGEVPAWVPETDPIYFDAEQKQFFGWVPSIPFGTETGTLTYDGQSHQVSGTGYHDHNWGNVPMQDGISRWYWGPCPRRRIFHHLRDDLLSAGRRQSDSEGVDSDFSACKRRLHPHRRGRTIAHEAVCDAKDPRWYCVPRQA
jgi:hypothetical protein